MSFPQQEHHARLIHPLPAPNSDVVLQPATSSPINQIVSIHSIYQSFHQSSETPADLPYTPISIDPPQLQPSHPPFTPIIEPTYEQWLQIFQAIPIYGLKHVQLNNPGISPKALQTRFAFWKAGDKDRATAPLQVQCSSQKASNSIKTSGRKRKRRNHESTSEDEDAILSLLDDDSETSNNDSSSEDEDLIMALLDDDFKTSIITRTISRRNNKVHLQQNNNNSSKNQINILDSSLATASLNLLLKIVATQSISASSNQSISQTKPAEQSIEQCFNESAHQPINLSIDQSVNDSIAQSINQSIDQSIKQPFDQPCEAAHQSTAQSPVHGAGQPPISDPLKDSSSSSQATLSAILALISQWEQDQIDAKTRDITVGINKWRQLNTQQTKSQLSPQSGDDDLQLAILATINRREQERISIASTQIKANASELRQFNEMFLTRLR